jgi:hypothetical protein
MTKLINPINSRNPYQSAAVNETETATQYAYLGGISGGREKR